MKDFFRITLFILLAPFYLITGFILDKTWKWWSDLGNFS